MKLILNEELRVIGFTRDPLFTDFHAETSDLPKLSEDQSLSDYKFIDGAYIYDPLPDYELPPLMEEDESL